MDQCKHDCEFWIYDKKKQLFEVVSRDYKTGCIRYWKGDKMVMGEPILK